ncbi:MAG: glycosyltransferase family 2 protein [Anaerolineae bacterium]
MSTHHLHMRTLPETPVYLNGDKDETLPENPSKTAPKYPRVSVVIPTLNEAKNLQYVLPFMPDWVHEVIIVDGNSTDDTIEVARATYPHVVVVEETRRGKGAALQAGFKAATGEVIAMLDADGSMNPQELSRYIGSLVSGADYVKGSRFIQGGGTSDMTTFRALGNWGLTTLVRLLFGGKYTDLCYGYNAFWSRVLVPLDIESDGFEVETLMNIRALRAGLTIVEIPSYESDRIFGTSNLRAIRDGWRVLKVILRERFSAPKNRVATHWSWRVRHPGAAYLNDNASTEV